MPSLSQLLFLAPALFAITQGQGVIIKAQGEKGSNAGLGLQVSQVATDANIIRNTEIVQNIVNECGRTLLAGNIDIGTITEEQLAANAVTSVTKAGTVDITIAQGGKDGAGPYTCDMDQTSNSLGAGQTKLKVAEKAPANGNIVLTVTMPADMACNGGMLLYLLPVPPTITKSVLMYPPSIHRRYLHNPLLQQCCRRSIRRLYPCPTN